MATQVSSCPISLMCLIFYKFKLQNIYGQDTKSNKGLGILVTKFVFMFSSRFMLFPTCLETYDT